MLPPPPAPPGPARAAAPRALAACITGCLVLALALLAVLLACRRLTGGHFVYALDDSYIGMAIARTLAFHGAWALNPGAFEPAASSPLWVLVLAAADRVAGARALTPFALDAALCLALLLAIARVLRHAIPRPWPRAAVATGIVLLAPAAALAVTGMEHALHALLALGLAGSAARELQADGDESRAIAARRLATLAVLAALATLTRFETLAMVAVFAAMALRARRPRVAFALVAGGALGVGAYALPALAHGGYWLPSSVLIKTRLRGLAGGPRGWLAFTLLTPRTLAAPHNAHVLLLILAALAALAALPRRGARDDLAFRAWLAAIVPVTLLQVQAGELSSFFRYEAWLVVSGLTALAGATGGAALARHGAAPLPRGRLAALAGVAALLVAALGVRAYRAFAWAPLASRNIYEQQYQSARFLRERLPGWRAAVSDIGTVAYYGGDEIVDLAGLADMTVARARFADVARSPWLGAYCARRGVGVAILYAGWLAGRGGPPPGWQALTRWAIRDNLVAAGDTVTVYSTRAATAPALRAAIAAFEPTLPARVARLDAAAGPTPGGCNLIPRRRPGATGRGQRGGARGDHRGGRRGAAVRLLAH
ncbi:MAG TPA: hypothetical protein VGU27_05505 [Candidatus Eisenbacteria bacterium]|nr:hypothetical protein [Candidatus Eisenbacteria bacterium]